MTASDQVSPLNAREAGSKYGKQDTLSIKYSSKEIQHVFGGSKVLVHYYVESYTDRVMNRYVVTCNVRGLEAASPELEVCRVEAWDNNRETLISEAVSELCGWEWDGICETVLPKEV